MSRHPFFVYFAVVLTIASLLVQSVNPALAAVNSSLPNKHNPTSTSSPTQTATATLASTSIPGAAACSLYPIALSAQTLAGAQSGDVIADILNGSQPGNFGWLSWAGDQSALALATSLTPPGDSGNYVNPNDPSDHTLSPGDWVSGKSGISNSSQVRDALDQLETFEIDLPVWDQATGSGDNTQYHTIDFAHVRIINYRLPHQNSISVQFLGNGCGNIDSTPAPSSTLTATPNVTPTPTATRTQTSIPTLSCKQDDQDHHLSDDGLQPDHHGGDDRCATPTATRPPQVTRTLTLVTTRTQTSTPTLFCKRDDQDHRSFDGSQPNHHGGDNPCATPTATRPPQVTKTPTLRRTPTATSCKRDDDHRFDGHHGDDDHCPTPTPTVTSAPNVTSTLTLTSTPSITDTVVLTATSTPTLTPTSTATSTDTPTLTPTSTDTATETPTSTPTFTSTPTNTPTFTPTATLPLGITCVNLRESLNGWIASAWLEPGVEIHQDGNGIYAYAASGVHQAGMYIQMPPGGPYRVLFYGQHLSAITVAQAGNAPADSGPLSAQITPGPDGSYFVTDDYLEVNWSFTAPVDLSNTPLFQTFCYVPFSPTVTRTPTLTPSPTETSTSTATETPSPTPTQIFNFSGLNVFVGYADSLRGNPSFPVPWQGAPNTAFIGTGEPYDAGAIRLENTTNQTISVQGVTVSFPGHSMFNGQQDFNLWGSFDIPAQSSIILTQTGYYDFDTSDNGIPGIGCAVPADPSYFPPTVTVVLADQTTSTMTDTGHVLDTGGRDVANCGGANEALQWQAIGTLGGNAIGNLFLNPTLSNAAIDGSTTLTAHLTDPSNQLPLSNVTVDFAVLSGPNAGQTGQGVTDSQGLTTFTYSSSQAGTDTVQASVTNLTGGTFTSNQVTVIWATATATPTITATPLPTSTPTATGTPPLPLIIPGWIGSPAEQGNLSGVVPITLADGVTLTDGSIDYWPADDTTQVTLLDAHVSGNGGDTLAAFDTTTLANGSYVIRLQGTNSDGVRQDSAVLVTVTGEYKPGRVRFTITDLTIPLVGMPITIGRTYDSLERGHSSDFGYGWSLAIGNPRLEINQAHDVTLTLPGGKRVSFGFTPRSYGGFFGFFLRPHYSPPAGVYGSLEVPDCLVVVSGGQYFCFLGGPYEPSQYTYTDPYGRRFVMGADGTLQSITDLDGNVLSFTPNGITSSLDGLSVPFVRDAQGRITRITDPEGNIYQYGYDAPGNLASVSLPGVSTPLLYHYDASHFFLDAVDPRGHALIADTYYPDGRLKNETDALGNSFQYAYDLNAHTTTVTNPDGGSQTSTYDENGMLLNQTDPLGNTTSYTYDASLNLLTTSDPLGHTTTYTYDAGGHQTSVTDALHKTHYISYNQYGGPTSRTDALGNVQVFGYDAHFHPTDVTDSLGTLIGFTWDTHGSMLTRLDGNGRTTIYTYDAYGNLLTETDPLTHTTTYTYDLLGRQTSMTDGRGNTTSTAYDPLGRVLAITASLGRTTHYTYDGNGNRISMTDPRGQHFTYTYDSANRLSEIDYPDGTTCSYTYDWRGNVLTQTDQAGHVTRYEYDLAGRLLNVTQAYGTADAGTTTYAYDAAGRKISQTDPLGHVTTYSYDANNRLLSVSAPLGHVTSYAYDDNGWRISTTDADHHATTFTYDARGRVTTTTYADGSTSLASYDGNGHVLSRTDQGGKTITYHYDEAGRLQSVIDPLTNTTAYSYDEVGNLLSILDANHHTTSFTYDALNRQTRKTWPDGSFDVFGYDLNNDLTSHQLADGHTNAYHYDEMGRLTSIDYFDGHTVTFTYTLDSLRQTVVDARGTTTYTYDSRHRLTQVEQPGGQTVSYTYDAAGNRLSLTSPAGIINYSYDDANRLAGVVDPAAGETTYTYDLLGLRTQLDLPNGVTVDYGYDALNRLTGIDQHRGSIPLASYDYQLDPAGNRLAVTNEDGTSIHWTYDDAYRLTDETRRNASNAVTSQTAFTYDPVGNRLSQSVNGVLTSYTYNSLDQLLTAGTAQYQYDGRGNLIQVTNGAQTTTYAYDAADRLIGATLPGGTAAAYGYDADGRRVSQSVGSQETNYLWDEASPYGNVVAETNGSGSLLAGYVLGGAELISQTRGAATSYYLHDGQGSVRSLTDVAGNVTDTYDYTAFGELQSQTGSTVNSYLYTGQQFDSLTGLYDLRARYYSPADGRFLSRDTFGFNRLVPAQLNRYVYVANDPIGHMDPTGHDMVEYSMTNDEESIATEESADEFAEAIERMDLDVDLNLYYREAVQNADSDVAVIGRFIKGSSESYEAIADEMGASHLNLRPELYEKFEALFEKVGWDPTEAWWKYFNEPFINETAAAGKDIYLTTPLSDIVPDSMLEAEFDALKELGYSWPKFDPDTGLWLMRLIR